LCAGDTTVQTRNQGSSASLIELALIIVLIAIIVMAILLIVGDDLRLWVVNTLGGLLGVK
jgi:Flp pilus assembly pilin Flp